MLCTDLSLMNFRTGSPDAEVVWRCCYINCAMWYSPLACYNVSSAVLPHSPITSMQRCQRVAAVADMPYRPVCIRPLSSRTVCVHGVHMHQTLRPWAYVRIGNGVDQCEHTMYKASRQNTITDIAVAIDIVCIATIANIVVYSVPQPHNIVRCRCGSHPQHTSQYW